MSEEKNIPQINREVSEAQLEKLKLEIKELKKKKNFFQKLTPYVGLITAVIGVSGFLFGGYQFLYGLEKNRITQERELSEKIENHLSSDVEKILLFTKDEKMSVAHASYLFKDLKTYIELKARTAKDPDEEARRLTRAVSDNLLYAMQNDCNFENRKDASFLWVVLNSWEDFAETLKKNEPVNATILDRQRNALKIFYSKDSEVVRTMTLDDSNESLIYPHGYGKLTPGEMVHLADILVNFGSTFKLLSDENKKKTFVIRFQAATCNRTLTKQILGTDYEPKDYDELRGCVK